MTPSMPSWGIAVSTLQAEPPIQSGVRLCSATGATDVTVIVFFLSAYQHVTEGIPREIEKALGRML